MTNDRFAEEQSEDVTVDSSVLKVLLIGPAGAGKSRFAKTFPTPAYLFNFDQAKLAYRGVEGITIKTLYPDNESWLEFEKTAKTVIADVAAGKYKTVIIDSMTTFSLCAMERALVINPDRSATGGAKGVAEKSHYGIQKNIMVGWINRLLAINCNLIFICHVATVQDEKLGRIYFAPSIVGKLKTDLPTFFTEVWYGMGGKEEVVNGVKKTIYPFLTQNDGMYAAKSVLSGDQSLLPKYIENDYATLISHLEKGTK